MKADELLARFIALEQQQQEAVRWDAQLRHVETAVNQLEAALQQWHNTITWHEGQAWSLTELQQLHNQLEEQERLWTINQQDETPAVLLEEWQTAVQQAETRLHTLATYEQEWQQIETLWHKWQAIAKKNSIIDKINTLQGQQRIEQAEYADLLSAYDHLQETSAQLEVQKQLYATIEQIISELDNTIAGDQKESWCQLAFDNINTLSQEIGIRLQAIADRNHTAQAQSDALQQQVEEADQALEPARQRVAELQAQIKTHWESFSNLPQELYQWGQDSSRLKLPHYLGTRQVDGESQTDLVRLLQIMQAEQHHLQWFNENVMSS